MICDVQTARQICARRRISLANRQLSFMRSYWFNMHMTTCDGFELLSQLSAWVVAVAGSIHTSDAAYLKSAFDDFFRNPWQAICTGNTTKGGVARDTEVAQEARTNILFGPKSMENGTYQALNILSQCSRCLFWLAGIGIQCQCVV